jgi:hypothetical protein
VVKDFRFPTWATLSLVSFVDLIASFGLDVLLIIKGGAYGTQFSCLSASQKIHSDSFTTDNMPLEAKKSESHEHSSTAGGIWEDLEKCESTHPNHADDDIEDGSGADEIVTEVYPDGTRRTIKTFWNPDGSKTISITTEQPNEYDNMQVRRSIATTEQPNENGCVPVRRSKIMEQKNNELDNMQVRRLFATEQPNEFNNVQVRTSIPLEQPSENDVHVSSRGRDPSIIKFQPNVSISTEQPIEHHDVQGLRGMDP